MGESWAPKKHALVTSITVISPPTTTTANVFIDTKNTLWI